MASKVNRARRSASSRRVTPQWALLALLVPTGSCVPAAAFQAAAIETQPSAPRLYAMAMPQGEIPLTGAPGVPIDGGLAGASPFAFRASTPIDQMRSLDCLAQAVYYEARSESEDGQRAVAQVVINRVRHPAWPNSVCGVVYQGPMRAGGGCQFTFTCDGSLAYRPQGPGWDRARRIAAEALAGVTFPGVGLSTHYHTNYVSPSWAPRLLRTAVIGAHIFYQLPGRAGLSSAFNAPYTGSEPVPRPAAYLPFHRATPAGPAAFAPTGAAETRAAVALPSDIPQEQRWVPENLPDSTIREEYRQSGQWREDAPGSMTGR